MKLTKISLNFLLIICSSVLVAAPVVTSVSPTNGTVAGGNVITITGSGFTGATSVNLGFRPATLFNVINDSTISATVPAGTAGTVDVRVTAASQTSPITRADLYSYTQSSWQGILSGTNQDAITLFDTGTNTISATIPLPADSLSAIITPDGTRIYAADSDIANVNVIDVATNTVIANIPTIGAGMGAFDIIVNPSGTRVYISNNTSGFVTVIDTATNTIVTDILVVPNLGPLSITPDGATVYVSNFTLGNITPIDTATNTVGMSIFTGITPGMTAITPDGTTAYVANLGSDTVSIIDVATNTITGIIGFPAGSGPYGSFILPNGLTMYVANILNATVSVIDLSTNTITNTIPVVPASLPFWVVATPDSESVYVINEATDDVTPIDVATNTPGPSFANIPGDIQDIVMSPDPSPVAYFTANILSSGSPSQFDASASLSPIGTIASYAWDFGDGNTLVTNTPVVNHIYATSGPFNVTLTVTNSAGTSTTQVFSSRFMSNNGGPYATLTQAFEVQPAPPINLRGYQKSCRYLSQTDFINVIKWNAPTIGQLPVAYRIYRDAALTDLVATIPATERLEYADHNRKKGKKYTYYIVSVDAFGIVSVPASITINPKP